MCLKNTVAVLGCRKQVTEGACRQQNTRGGGASPEDGLRTLTHRRVGNKADLLKWHMWLTHAYSDHQTWWLWAVSPHALSRWGFPMNTPLAPRVLPKFLQNICLFLANLETYIIDHKLPIYIQNNPKSNRKEYEAS